jgi:spore coat polysaccharide biosynthesis protein SpsF (cytidylyltransferase family)/aryl-alcohol dehydrogenase-like predicted oxidoreductase
MINKLILGSANFGLEYGISNMRKLGKDEIFNILDTAYSLGLQGVDTAKAYGDAEKIIGDFFLNRGKLFKIITKLPMREYKSDRDVENEIFGSMRNMNIGFIDCMLVHSYKSYMMYADFIMPVLKAFRKEGIIGQYGLSVYDTFEVEEFIAKENDAVVIEFPANLFDKRFMHGNFIEKLKSAGHFLLARSVFLQGMFFLNQDIIKKKFPSVKDKVLKIKSTANNHNLNIECLALLFVLLRPSIDGVIIGVDSKEHLKRNVICIGEKNIAAYRKIEHLLADIESRDRNIILPFEWNKKLKKAIVLQARNSSSRYPYKMLHDFMGKTSLEWVMSRCEKADVDLRILATSIDPSDDILAEIARKNGWSVVRGSVHDVLSRYAKAVCDYELDVVVRITGDCILTDYRLINTALITFYEKKADYVGLTGIIDGFDVEVIKSQILLEADIKAILPSEREHVTPYIYTRPENFKIVSLPYGNENLSNIHLSLDYLEDAIRIGYILEKLRSTDFRYEDVVALTKDDQELLSGARNVILKEGYIKSLKEDKEFNRILNGDIPSKE